MSNASEVVRLRRAREQLDRERCAQMIAEAIEAERARCVALFAPFDSNIAFSPTEITAMIEAS